MMPLLRMLLLLRANVDVDVDVDAIDDHDAAVADVSRLSQDRRRR